MQPKIPEPNRLVLLEAAHKLCFKNADIIKSSKLCGCFKCLEIYESSTLTDEDFWEEADGTFTVYCPKCGIDSVISDQCESLSTEFLREMNDYYFDGYVSNEKE